MSWAFLREEEVMEGTEGQGGNMAAHACPPPCFGEWGVWHACRQPGSPQQSWDTRLGLSLPASYPPPCSLRPGFPAKVLRFYCLGGKGQYLKSLRNWFQFNNFIAAVGPQRQPCPAG